MRFKLNKEALNANIFKDGDIKHNTGIKLRLFPFPANDTKLNSVKPDLKDFKGIAGTCFRECSNLSHKNNFDKDSFVKDVCIKAGSPNNPNLRNLIESVAFNEFGQLVLFNPLIYPYIRNIGENENPTINNIGKYIAALFFDGDDKEKLQTLSKNEPDNLFYKLILDCIPSHKGAKEASDKFYQTPIASKKYFKNDLNLLLEDQEFFVSNFHNLLKFYFFKHVTELSIKLNMFFSEKREQLFFSVKWEKLQSFRKPILNGWDLFLGHINPIFTHAVTLELVNHIEGFNITQVTYKEIKDCVEKLDIHEKQNLVNCLKELIAMYKDAISDVNWNNFIAEYSGANTDIVFEQVLELYQTVAFQFAHSIKGRNRAREAYRSWIKEFATLNFSKKRGQLGHSLNLDHEFLLFLTRLCVGNSEKIRLKELWKELENRGVYFDNTSKDHIIQYFEKINLLEKKSDSGDAQYVRKFSQILG